MGYCCDLFSCCSQPSSAPIASCWMCHEDDLCRVQYQPSGKIRLPCNLTAYQHQSKRLQTAKICKHPLRVWLAVVAGAALHFWAAVCYPQVNVAAYQAV